MKFSTKREAFTMQAVAYLRKGRTAGTFSCLNERTWGQNWLQVVLNADNPALPVYRTRLYLTLHSGNAIVFLLGMSLTSPPPSNHMVLGDFSTA